MQVSCWFHPLGYSNTRRLFQEICTIFHLKQAGVASLGGTHKLQRYLQRWNMGWFLAAVWLPASEIDPRFRPAMPKSSLSCALNIEPPSGLLLARLYARTARWPELPTQQLVPLIFEKLKQVIMVSTHATGVSIPLLDWSPTEICLKSSCSPLGDPQLN